MPEHCVLDPVEFMPERVELDLHSLGLEVRSEGVDWGESTIEAQMVRMAEGEDSSDGRRPGVPIRIPIRVKQDGAVSLAEAAHKLQQKVGTWQKLGGWIRRDYDDDGGFAGSLGYKIIRHTTNLSGLQGWLFAHRRDAPEVILTATRWPIGYRPDEVESAEFKEETERELVYELDPSNGTTEGLERTRVTNLGAEDWRGLIYAKECLDAPVDFEDPTALLAYQAKDLTPLNGAIVKEVSGVKAIEHTALKSGWLAFAGSEISGVGHMTHRGVRRLWLRVKDLAEGSEFLQFRVFYRAVGSSRWVEDNPIKSVPIAGDECLVDVGAARLQPHLLGDPRWEFKILVRAPGGTGGIRLRDVYVLPTEQYSVLREPYRREALDELRVEDTFDQSSGGLSGKTLAIGGAWSGTGDADDFSVDSTTHRAKRTAVSDSTGTGRYAIAGSSQFTDTVVSVEFESSNPKEPGSNRNFGCLARYVDPNNWLALVARPSSSEENFVNWRVAVRKKVGGTATDLGVTPFAVCRVEAGTPISLALELVVTALGSWFLFVDGKLWRAGSDSDLAAGSSTLEKGKAGLLDEWTVAAAHTRTYDNFRVAVPTAEDDRVCFAGKSLEIASDGVEREHRDLEDAWGPLLPLGFLPYVTAGGLESKPSRCILIPSQGDFETLADRGSNKLGAISHMRDGYHFAREGV